MSNPLQLPLPRAVRLRNGMFAQVESLVEEPSHSYMLLGHLPDGGLGQGEPALWTRTGRFEAARRTHPLDIVAIVTPNGALAYLQPEVSSAYPKPN